MTARDLELQTGWPRVVSLRILRALGEERVLQQIEDVKQILPEAQHQKAITFLGQSLNAESITLESALKQARE